MELGKAAKKQNVRCFHKPIVITANLSSKKILNESFDIENNEL